MGKGCCGLQRPFLLSGGLPISRGCGTIFSHVALPPERGTETWSKSSGFSPRNFTSSQSTPRRWWSFWTRATPCPSSPATARSATAPWMTRPSGSWRTVWPTCGAWSSAGARCGRPSRSRASSRRSWPPPWSAPPPWRRWRTSTAPTGPSAAPAPGWPGKRGWSPWPSCSWRGRTPRAAPCGKAPRSWPLPMSARRRVWKPGRRPSRAPAIFWPRASPMTPPSESGCGPCSRKTACCARWPPRRRTLSTACTTTSPSRCAACKATGCWPSTGGRRRASSRWPSSPGRRAPCPASSGTCRPATPTGSCWSKWPRTPGPGCCSPLWSGKSAET